MHFQEIIYVLTYSKVLVFTSMYFNIFSNCNLLANWFTHIIFFFKLQFQNFFLERNCLLGKKLCEEHTRTYATFLDLTEAEPLEYNSLIVALRAAEQKLITGSRKFSHGSHEEGMGTG